MIKNNYVLDKTIELELVGFNEIDVLIQKLENKAIRELIMKIESMHSDRIFLAIKQSLQNDLRVLTK